MAVTVLSIPHLNSYVEAAIGDGTLVDVGLTDRQARGWDLHPAFTPGWLAAHRHQVEVVHLHFGFERLSEAQLHSWIRELLQEGIPLVVTVHDLRNPHLADRSHHDRQLGLLLAAASTVITLTAGAAAEIARRFGRHADVIEHPGLLTGWVRQTATPTVGIYLKRRAQVVDPDAVVAAALAGTEPAGARLRVDAQPELLDHLPGTVSLASKDRLDLGTTGYLEESAFASYLGGLAVSVLPYRFGTHSGWLEACRDVGTAVVAPDCGYYQEQWDEVVTYGNNESTGLDPASLTRAVAAALARPRPGRADPAWRSEQRRAIRAAHAGVYRTVVTERIAA